MTAPPHSVPSISQSAFWASYSELTVLSFKEEEQERLLRWKAGRRDWRAAQTQGRETHSGSEVFKCRLLASSQEECDPCVRTQVGPRALRVLSNHSTPESHSQPLMVASRQVFYY